MNIRHRDSPDDETLDDISSQVAEKGVVKDR